MKLRKKLIALFLFISTIPFLAGTGVILLQSGRAARQKARGYLAAYSATAAGVLDAFFEREAGPGEPAPFFPGLGKILDALTAPIGEQVGDGLIFLILSENDRVLSRREFDPTRGNYTERALNVQGGLPLDSLPAALRQASRDLVTGSSLTYWDESGGGWYYMTGASVPGAGCRVVLALSEGAFAGTARDIMRMAVVILIITAAVMFPLAVMFSGRITGPLVKIALALKGLSEGGGLAETVDAPSKDEIGDLARYFNAALEKIKTLLGDIKKEACSLIAIGDKLAGNIVKTNAAMGQITAGINKLPDLLNRGNQNAARPADTEGFYETEVVSQAKEKFLAKMIHETGDFAGYRILLAENTRISRKIGLALLESMKLTVDCAENGVEAVKLFEAQPEKYDMIFMEVQMPGMDGYEAARRIRAIDAPRAREIPIIAMTASVFRRDIKRYLDAGMDDHANKPLDFGNVLFHLRKYLRPRVRQ
jgi:CheY-like chemotaxis protein/HAMP domain-containing protein